MRCVNLQGTLMIKKKDFNNKKKGLHFISSLQ